MMKRSIGTFRARQPSRRRVVVATQCGVALLTGRSNLIELKGSIDVTAAAGLSHNPSILVRTNQCDDNVRTETSDDAGGRPHSSSAKL